MSSRSSDGAHPRRRTPPDDPCAEESQISMRCMAAYNQERAKCRDEFENYNLCRAFWERVKRERRTKGLTPALPSPEERSEILERHFAA